MRRVFEVNVLGAYLTARERPVGCRSRPAGQRFDRTDVVGRVAARLAEPLCRLSRLEGRDRHPGHRPFEGAWPGGRAGQRPPPRPHRDGNPRERGEPDRTRKPSAAPPRSGAGHDGGNRGGGDLAPERRRLLRHRRHSRRDRRTLGRSPVRRSLREAAKQLRSCPLLPALPNCFAFALPRSDTAARGTSSDPGAKGERRRLPDRCLVSLRANTIGPSKPPFRRLH